MTSTTPQRAERRRLWTAVLVLLACLLGVALLEDPALHGDPKPGPNAPAYVNWRTGEWVTP